MKSVFHMKILEKLTFVGKKAGRSKKINKKFRKHCFGSWSLCLSYKSSEFIANGLFTVVYFVV